MCYTLSVANRLDIVWVKSEMESFRYILIFATIEVPHIMRKLVEPLDDEELPSLQGEQDLM